MVPLAALIRESSGSQRPVVLMSSIPDLNDKVKSYLTTVRLRELVQIQHLSCDRLINEANYHPRIAFLQSHNRSMPVLPRVYFITISFSRFNVKLNRPDYYSGVRVSITRHWSQVMTCSTQYGNYNTALRSCQAFVGTGGAGFWSHGGTMPPLSLPMITGMLGFTGVGAPITLIFMIRPPLCNNTIQEDLHDVKRLAEYPLPRH